MSNLDFFFSLLHVARPPFVIHAGRGEGFCGMRTQEFYARTWTLQVQIITQSQLHSFFFLEDCSQLHIYFLEDYSEDTVLPLPRKLFSRFYGVAGTRDRGKKKKSNTSMAIKKQELVTVQDERQGRFHCVTHYQSSLFSSTSSDIIVLSAKGELLTSISGD